MDPETIKLSKMSRVCVIVNKSNVFNQIFSLLPIGSTLLLLAGIKKRP